MRHLEKSRREKSCARVRGFADFYQRFFSVRHPRKRPPILVWGPPTKSVIYAALGLPPGGTPSISLIPLVEGGPKIEGGSVLIAGGRVAKPRSTTPEAIPQLADFTGSDCRACLSLTRAHTTRAEFQNWGFPARRCGYRERTKPAGTDMLRKIAERGQIWGNRTLLGQGEPIGSPPVRYLMWLGI
jgi:hypothetical protein